MTGISKVSTAYDIRFVTTVEWQELCERHLTQTEVRRLAEAIEDDFFFELHIDDLPVWGFLGEHVEDDVLLAQTGRGSAAFVYTHYKFHLEFNGDKVVAANVSADLDTRVQLLVDNPDGQKLDFSFSVEWIKSNIPVRGEASSSHQTGS